MRRTLLMIMAVALLLTQCRKQAALPTSGPANGNTVSMTVTAGHGSKTDINGTTGAVTWSDGDRLYVGAGGKYVGHLTLVSGAGEATGTFSGTVIAEPGECEFGFYYLGGRDYTPTLVTGVSTSIDIPFATQTGVLSDASSCHIGYGTAEGRVDGNGIAIDGEVQMASEVAIAYFEFKDGTPEEYSGAITLSGEHICNSMTVGFGGSFAGTAGTAGRGIILTDNTSPRKYVVLVPTGTGEETLRFGGGAVGGTTLRHGIEANKFYCFGSGGPIDVSVRPVEFSVSSGTTVSFSPGNLQYWGDAVEKKWRFAEHQWDYLGGNGQGSTNETARRDLFGWGCTGFQDTRSDAPAYQKNYQPYSTSTASVSGGTGINDYGYGPDYYSGSAYCLSVLYMSDWGCNTIYTHYGDATGSGWRTLTSAEWKYLLDTRTTVATGIPASSRYALVKVDGKCGMMIFPDEFAWPSSVTTKPGTFNTYSSDWNGVNYGVGAGSDFEALEGAGVVFLPAAGLRNGTGLYYVGSGGYYWSSSCYSSNYACIMNFDSGYVNPQVNFARYCGFSVRLVR